MAVLAAGCTGGSSSTPDQATNEGVASSPQTAATDDAADAPAEGAGDGTDDVASTPTLLRTDPLVTTEHPLADRGGSLDIELRADEVGDLLRVAVTFTPRGIAEGQTSIAELLGAYAAGDGISGRLIDAANLLEYQTVRPAVPHGSSAPAHVDQPTTLMFYFGAPVEPIETFDFLLDFEVSASNWPGFVDVPFDAA